MLTEASRRPRHGTHTGTLAPLAQSPSYKPDSGKGYTMKRLLITVLLLFKITPVSITSAAVVVVPNNLIALEGTINNGWPFDTSAQRYQQVFAASEFLALSGPQLITGIAFRPDAEFGNPFSATISDIQINLSTTRVAPDALRNLADNVGADDTMVFSGHAAVQRLYWSCYWPQRFLISSSIFGSLFSMILPQGTCCSISGTRGAIPRHLMRSPPTATLSPA